MGHVSSDELIPVRQNLSNPDDRDEDEGANFRSVEPLNAGPNHHLDNDSSYLHNFSINATDVKGPNSRHYRPSLRAKVGLPLSNNDLGSHH